MKMWVPCHFSSCFVTSSTPRAGRCESLYDIAKYYVQNCICMLTRPLTQRLYRGLGSALGGAGLSWALYFAWNDWFKRSVIASKIRKGLKGKLSGVEEMMCAAVAGILTTLVVNPIWVINTRLKLAAERRKRLDGRLNGALGAGTEAASPPAAGAPVGKEVKAVKEKNTVAAIVALVKREGILGWLSGIIPALILLINPAIQLAVYGWLRKWVARQRGAPPRASDAFIMGAISKFFAVILTFPAQTIKLRMQAGLTGPEGSIWREIVCARTLADRRRLIQCVLLPSPDPPSTPKPTRHPPRPTRAHMRITDDKGM